MNEYSNREYFEEMEMEEIGKAIMDGYYSGMTNHGTTWSVDINFDYDAMETEDE